MDILGSRNNTELNGLKKIKENLKFLLKEYH